jgi:hypothetical protein
MILETKCKAISAALIEKGLADFDWSQILEFFMSLMGDCFPSKEPLLAARRMTWGQKAAMGVYIRQEFGVRGMRKVAAIRSVMLAELESSSDDEIEKVWQEANNELHPDFSVM